ncbi:hypothetical protein CPLU01_15532 [Colletotrichum plurivorum]|uniref:Uncharacterized protein n=1 Tax=Colletotrichum plurivorum TaxID=2175906 RepID=A0A8H6JA97_9PEZI|nr:hypothetical protein CPLU01_15532 [Colletotrichum plurivorum]
MASYRAQPTPPSQDATLERLLATAPRTGPYIGLNGACLRAEMALLLNPPRAPVSCTEPAEEFDTVNAHFSDQVHAFFNAVHAFEKIADKQSPEEPKLIREDSGLGLVICVQRQSYDIYPDCWHQCIHTRRLTVMNSDSLPLLNRVTNLRVYTIPDDVEFVHMRPISPR